MSEYTWTSTQYKIRPKTYRVVKGKPLDVELEVNQLIKKGFVLSGDMMEYVLPGTNDKIFVQAMVLYEDPQ